MQHWAIGDVPADYAVGPFAVDFVLRAYGHRTGLLRVELCDESGAAERLNPARTLWDEGVRDGAKLRIYTIATAGGYHPDILLTVGGIIASGVLGNAAYDLVKMGSQNLLQRWAARARSSKARTFRIDQAAEFAHSLLCERFGVFEPKHITLRKVEPVTLECEAGVITKLKRRRFAAHVRYARSWRCIFDVDNEEGTPDMLAVLVHANPSGPTRDDIWVIMAEPAAEDGGSSESGQQPIDH
jgi:hypothetical protein